MTEVFDVKPAIIKRLQILNRAENDADFRALLLARSAKDICFWINTFVVTFDPRRKPSNIPFDLFLRQEEYLIWRQQRRQLKEHCLVEKSRDCGLSWLNCAAQLHAWLFETGYAGTMGSRKEILVDRIGDSNSLFEKIRMMIMRLPQWMTPKYTSGYLKIINHDNGSTITGESGYGIGRGGRSSVLDLDEAAFLEQPARIDAAVSQNSDVVVYCSTPNGAGNPFYQKRFSGKIPVFTFRWQSDPRKSQAWYDKQVATLDPVIVAAEIDIDYNASIEGICIPHKWILAAVELDLPRTGDRIGGLDIADEGKDLNVLIVHQGPVVTSVDSWAEGNTTQTAYKALELGRQYGLKHLNYDSGGVGAGVGGTLKSCDTLPFAINGIISNASPSETIWEDFNDKTSKELFKNLRAELWWLLRRRFEKTYEHVNGERSHPLDELISIPNHATLIAQIGQPLRRFNDSGKIVIESKEDMQRRGVKSPDFGDSLVYCFSPPPKESIWAIGEAAW